MAGTPIRLISTVFLVFTFWSWSSGPAAAIPPINRLSLPNQMVLLLTEEHSLPFVTLQVVIDAGSRQDSKGKEGLAFLTTKGLLRGTSRQTFNPIDEALDFMGASLNVSANKDLCHNQSPGFEKRSGKRAWTISGNGYPSIFPEEELRKESHKILGAIKSAEEDLVKLRRRLLIG